MQKLKEAIRRRPIVRYILLPYRAWVAFSYSRSALAKIPRWLINSRETNNFTYDLTDICKGDLALLVSLISGLPNTETAKYMRELEQDQALQDHVRQMVQQGPRRYTSDANARPGRRYVYYALARAIKPRVLVEAGTDRGYGTCILASALARNAQEGCPGRLYSTDISPVSGELFQAPYSQFGELLRGDSCQSLARLDRQIDLFLHEDVCDVEYETRQYELITPKLSPQAVVATPWSGTNVLAKFAGKWGKSYLVFRDQPKNHWHPGSSLGIAFTARSPQ